MEIPKGNLEKFDDKRKAKFKKKNQY